MTKNRLEAFSDGVLAIIITIMVLELKVPHGSKLEDLTPLIPIFSSYVLSFAYVAIYWGNHHHLFQVTKHVNGAIIWANSLLLFFLSLIPFATAWLGENFGQAWPTAIYGIVLLLAAAAYTFMSSLIVKTHPEQKAMVEAMSVNWKERASLASYIVGTVCAFFLPWLSIGFYALVALLWIVPDKRAARVAMGE